MSRPKLYDREVVLERATALFWKRGFAATSMSELAAKTKVNVYSIYNEFGDKDSLFIACLDNFFSNYFFVEDMLTRQPLGLKNIQTLFDYKIKTYSKEAEKGCLIFNSVAEKDSISSEANKKVDAFLSKMTILFYNCLIAAQKKREISRSKDCEALADYLSIYTFGMVNLGMKKMSRKKIRKTMDLALAQIKS